MSGMPHKKLKTKLVVSFGIYGGYLVIASLTQFVSGVTQRVSLLEQELPTLPEHLMSHKVFNVVRVARFLAFCVVYCRSLFVILSFGCFWPLCCLSFFVLRILIIPLVSSNCS